MLDIGEGTSYDQFLLLLGYLGVVAVVAFVIERILDFVFDYRPIRERIKNKGIKAPIALALSLFICFWRELDIFAALFRDSETSFVGMVLTGFFLAGGAGAAMTLFHNVLGLSQSLKRERQEMARLEQQSRSQQLLAQAYRPNRPGGSNTLGTQGQSGKLAFASMEDLVVGSTGQDVAGLQYALSTLGYLDPGFELGRYCAATERAVRAYQEASGLLVDGVAGCKTKGLVQSRCCGVPDKRLALQRGGAASTGCRWEASTITYWLENLTNDLPEARCRTLIAEAFGVWAEAGDLAFQEVADGTTAMIRIRWSDPGALSEIGPLHVFAYTFYPPPCGNPTPGTVIFDESDRWLDDGAPPGAEGRNLRLVAIHEIGHALGLDHSAGMDDIMFRYPEHAGPRDLSAADVAAIQGLYNVG